jgi:hydrogenase maturation factor
VDRPLHTGKLPAALLAELLRRAAGAAGMAPELRIGPRVGEDACAIDVPAGTLVAAADPITLTGGGAGAHAVLVNANDVAVMGVRPRWFLAVVMVPPGERPDALRALFDDMRRALDRVGAVLVGGHTEVTDAVRQPLVVGHMLGLAAPGAVIATGGARAGDVVVQVGPAPVEGAAVLAAECPDAITPALRERALAAMHDPGISVVGPALRAAELGATSLHDPTEGGLATGLHEVADASGIALVVDEAAVAWFEPGVAVCHALGADPWCTLASGTLLACFPEDRADAALCALSRDGAPVARIARAEAGAGVVTRAGRALPRSERDEVARVLDARARA